MLALSTVPPLLGTTKDDRKNKPALLKFYDYTKGGTDIVDQRIGTYTTNCKSSRWTATAFCYVLDTARVNSQTLHAHLTRQEPRKTNSFDFGMSLVKDLVLPLILRRDTTYLSKEIIGKMCSVIGRQPRIPEVVIPIEPGSRKRCRLCIANQDSIANKQRVGAIKTACSKCKNAVCKRHSKITICCDTCLSEL